MNLDQAIAQAKEILGCDVECDVFIGGAPFLAWRNASAYAAECELDVGTMSVPMPVALVHRDKHFYPPKWQHISIHDHHQLDGVLLSDSFRDGPVFFCVRVK